MRVVRGHGRLTGRRTVEVEGQTFTARRGVVLNPGTRPSVPPIDGLDQTAYWTNRDVFKIEELPRSLAIVGGGPVGVELAQAFARFGVDVTLVEVGPRIMQEDEPEAAEVVAAVLRDDGVKIRACTSILSVTEDDLFHIDVDGDDVSAERLLIAAGRTPNLDHLGLQTIGLDPAARSLETDEWMRAAEGVAAPSATSPVTARSRTSRSARPTPPSHTCSAVRGRRRTTAPSRG